MRVWNLETITGGGARSSQVENSNVALWPMDLNMDCPPAPTMSNTNPCEHRAKWAKQQLAFRLLHQWYWPRPNCISHCCSPMRQEKSMQLLRGSVAAWGHPDTFSRSQLVPFIRHCIMRPYRVFFSFRWYLFIFLQLACITFGIRKSKYFLNISNNKIETIPVHGRVL